MREYMSQHAKVGDEVMIKGEVAFSALKNRTTQTDMNNQPYECYALTIRNPEVIQGQQTGLGQALTPQNADKIGSGLVTEKGSNPQSPSYLIYLKQKGPYPVRIIDGQHKIPVSDAPELLEGELASGQIVQVALEYVSSPKGNPFIKISGVMVEDASNIAYYSAGNNVSGLFGDLSEGQSNSKAYDFEQPSQQAPQQNGFQQPNQGFQQQNGFQQPNQGFQQQGNPFGGQQQAPQGNPFGNQQQAQGNPFENQQQPQGNPFETPQGNPFGPSVDANDQNTPF